MSSDDPGDLPAVHAPDALSTPDLADEGHWYTEHAALVLGTLKWALLGGVAGACVGLGTRAFLWALGAATAEVRALDGTGFHFYFLLPVALPVCVWLIRTFAPDAKGHGTEAVIAAVHQRSGKIEWQVAPIKLLATVVTLAFGGSVGKEGPCAQIGAAMTSLFADLLRLSDEDRRRLVICGISAGFAAVFGTPISGALFGIEVLYLGRIEYPVLFPCVVAGIVAHLVCNVPPPAAHLHEGFETLTQPGLVLLSMGSGALFGLVALLLIETMRLMQRTFRRFESRPYALAAAGGVILALIYLVAGDAYAGLGIPTIESALGGAAGIALSAFLVKIVVTALTLEVGGSGGIVTPIFFIGATSGVALAQLFHLPQGVFAAFGLIAVLAAAANTPIAASVMGMEILPGPVGVYAALCACSAYLLVGHRSVYASQKLGFTKAASLDIPLHNSIGDLRRASMRLREASLAARVNRLFGGTRRRP